jgi:hypothetical protein
MISRRPLIACEMNNRFWHTTLVAFTVMPPILTIGQTRATIISTLSWGSWYESLHSGKRTLLRR